MQFFPIKTKPLNPPKDDLLVVIDKYITDLKDGDIIFITSKVVSIHEGNCVKNDGKISKEDLVKQETKNIIDKDLVPGKGIFLTIKDNILIPSAGIDESNANGYFILWPKNSLKFCKEVHKFLCEKFSIKNLGIIITDSTTKPLKRGVVGISTCSYEINPLIDKRGQKDIFGKKLSVTQINVVDALAGSAVYLMGEANETQPIVIARNIPNIVYSTDETLYGKMGINPEKDLYGEILKPLMRNKVCY